MGVTLWLQSRERECLLSLQSLMKDRKIANRAAQRVITRHLCGSEHSVRKDTVWPPQDAQDLTHIGLPQLRNDARLGESSGSRQ